MLEENTGMRLFQSEEGSNLHGFVFVFVLNTDIFFPEDKNVLSSL